MNGASYLGDGVYAQIDPRGLVLTTESHELGDANNIIVLEPEVLAALEKYVAKQREKSL